MSLLGDNTVSDIPEVTGNIVVQCTTCGNEFYVQVPPGKTANEVVSEMVCPCGNSTFTVKGNNTVEYQTVEKS